MFTTEVKLILEMLFYNVTKRTKYVVRKEKTAPATRYRTCEKSYQNRISSEQLH